MQLTIKKTFDWAHLGVEIKTYTEGQEVDTEDEDMVSVALSEGWAVAADGDDKPAKKSRKAAPENKAHDAAPEDK